MRAHQRTHVEWLKPVEQPVPEDRDNGRRWNELREPHQHVGLEFAPLDRAAADAIAYQQANIRNVRIVGSLLKGPFASASIEKNIVEPSSRHDPELLRTLEPPGFLSGLYGLHVCPPSELIPEIPAASSFMFDFPRITAPASRRRRT